MPHHERGVENYKKGHYQYAITEFNKSLEHFPDNVLTYIYRGNAYTALKDY
jgi:tetratricopeptide (TPR) repeat protein